MWQFLESLLTKLFIYCYIFQASMVGYSSIQYIDLFLTYILHLLWDYCGPSTLYWVEVQNIVMFTLHQCLSIPPDAVYYKFANQSEIHLGLYTLEWQNLLVNQCCPHTIPYYKAIAFLSFQNQLHFCSIKTTIWQL